MQLLWIFISEQKESSDPLKLLYSVQMVKILLESVFKRPRSNWIKITHKQLLSTNILC